MGTLIGTGSTRIEALRYSEVAAITDCWVERALVKGCCPRMRASEREIVGRLTSRLMDDVSFERAMSCAGQVIRRWCMESRMVGQKEQ